MKMNTLIPKTESIVSDARIVWKALNGIFAVYKPAEVTYLNMRDTLIRRLCEDLNSMHVRPPIQHVSIQGDTRKNMKVVVHPSYADHLLVAGPRYQVKDIKLATANYLSTDMSGLTICGINSGIKLTHQLRQSKSPISYKIKGILGQATDNYFKTGKIVEKSTYKHVYRNAIEKICASMQAAHQKKMFELCGVDMQSQAAYDLAVQGLLRPANNEIPMIYTIKCIDFKSPEFTLEVVCINAYDMYLKTIVHDLGMQLRSTATCIQIQCFRYALFDLDFALLRKHWELQNILENIERCHNILNQNRDLLKQYNPILTERNNANETEN